MCTHFCLLELSDIADLMGNEVLFHFLPFVFKFLVSGDIDKRSLSNTPVEIIMTFQLQIQTGVNWTVHDAAEEAIKVRRYY